MISDPAPERDTNDCPHATIGLLFFVAVVLAIAVAAMWTVDPTDDVLATLLVVPLVIHLLHRHAGYARRHAVHP